MGKIITIEGVDGSGKSTQTKMLCDKLSELGYKCKRIHYPNYDSYSSYLVRNYLNGDISNDIKKISPYAIHAMYALDRYLTYINEWKDFYNEENSIIIMDRYIESTMLYQTASFQTKYKKLEIAQEFMLYETEKLGMPRSDLVIFLSMSPEVSKKFIDNRCDKTNSKKDIHESDDSLINDLNESYKLFSSKYDWRVINCDPFIEKFGDKSKEAINQRILGDILKYIV